MIYDPYSRPFQEDPIRARFSDYEVDESGLRRTYQAHVRGFKVVPIAT